MNTPVPAATAAARALSRISCSAACNFAAKARHLLLAGDDLGRELVDLLVHRCEIS